MKKILFLMGACACLFAQEADDFDDIMSGEFSDTKPIVQKKSNANHINVDFSGVLKLRTYSFVQNTDYKNRNNDKSYADGLLEVTSKAKKDKFIGSATAFGIIGTDYTTYDYGKVLEEFRDTNKKVPVAGLKELYLLYSADNYDLLFGKKVFKVGISTLYSPSNVYNVTLSPDPLDPYTIGTWLGKASYYQDNTEYSFVVFPCISNSKTFSEKSRWAGNDDKSSQNEGSFIIPASYQVVEDKENKVRFLARLKSNAVLFNRGVDYMLDVGYGPSLYDILEKTDKQNVYLKTKPEMVYTSGGFSTTYEKFEFHGEVYYQHSIDALDDDFISAVGGASYNLDKWVDKVGFNEVKMIVEYVREIITHDASNDKTYESSRKERAPKNDILVKVDGEISDKLSLTYFGNFRLELNQQKDSGRYQKFSVNYKIKDGLNSDLFVETFNGDENSYYGKWKKNDRIGLDLKYSF